MSLTPAKRQHRAQGATLLSPTERYAPMASPPNGKRFAHWRSERAVRNGVRFGVMVDDPAFARALRNARKRERQGR